MSLATILKEINDSFKAAADLEIEYGNGSDANKAAVQADITKVLTDFGQTTNAAAIGEIVADAVAVASSGDSDAIMADVMQLAAEKGYQLTELQTIALQVALTSAQAGIAKLVATVSKK